MALPLWTNGIIIKNGLAKPNGIQYIRNNLSCNLLVAGRINITNAIPTLNITTTVSNANITYDNNNGPKLTLTCPDSLEDQINGFINFNSNIQIGYDDIEENKRNLIMNQNGTFDSLLDVPITTINSLGYGTKLEPKEISLGEALFFYNKLFFRYEVDDPANPEDSSIIVASNLVETGLIYLKDITGTKNIPEATLTIRGLGTQNPSVVIGGIIPTYTDPEGKHYAQGMLLII